MAIGPENVVVVYRQNDDESLEFAQRYRDFHSLNDDQLIAVPCSNVEVLASYSDFESEVEIPLETELATGIAANRTVWAIVLMPRVPGGFIDGGDTISSTSRLSRIYHPYKKKTLNDLFNRQVFKRFDGDDADISLICSRFDSPLAAVTKEWFDASETAFFQIHANGKFFFDPYSAYNRSGVSDYEDDLLFFHDNLLQRLGNEIVSTVRIDPYIDPIIGSVEQDSFYWGWGADRASLSFFKDTLHLRSFFYNADFDGAGTMRDLDERRFPLLAIRSGYASSAGHMSDPGVDGFLRPTPFYDALFRGATMGEAMLFSVPHVDWTTAFFGDPLVKTTFPGLFVATDLIDPDNSWQQMVNCTAQSVVNIFRKSIIIKEVRDFILKGDDVDIALDLANPIERVYRNFNDDSWRNDYVKLAKALINFSTAKNQTTYDRHFPKLNDYLARTGNAVPDIILDVLQNDALKDSIDDENRLEEGSWDFDFELQHSPGAFAFYHFELDVSATEDFAEILVSKKSQDDVISWSFENSEGEFEQLSDGGMPSSFAGKDVRYSSQDSEFLERGLYYYFRIRQRDQQKLFEYRTFRQVIYR